MGPLVNLLPGNPKGGPMSQVFLYNVYIYCTIQTIEIRLTLKGNISALKENL